MADADAALLAEIDRLNQRGGRMLSLADLLAAGTVGLDLAAEMAAVASAGGSILTAAGPGGVGKTTLMGALLGCAPAEARLVPIESPRTLDRLDRAGPRGEPECLLVHEIGSGPYYGYLWGPAVGRYFALATGPGRMLASNLHAEGYDEARAQLLGPPLGVDPQDLARVDLLAFMAVRGGRRRVTEVYVADGRGGHERAWRWRAEQDAFERVAGPSASDDGTPGRWRELLAGAHPGPVDLLRGAARSAGLL